MRSKFFLFCCGSIVLSHSVCRFLKIWSELCKLSTSLRLKSIYFLSNKPMLSIYSTLGPMLATKGSMCVQVGSPCPWQLIAGNRRYACKPVQTLRHGTVICLMWAAQQTDWSVLPARKCGDEKSGKTSWRRWLELNNLERWVNGFWKVLNVIECMVLKIAWHSVSLMIYK